MMAAQACLLTPNLSASIAAFVKLICLLLPDGGAVTVGHRSCIQ